MCNAAHKVGLSHGIVEIGKMLEVAPRCCRQNELLGGLIAVFELTSLRPQPVGLHLIVKQTTVLHQRNKCISVGFDTLPHQGWHA